MNRQTPPQTPHEAAIRRGRLLEYLSVAWMVVEATVGIGAGILAGSIALVGFGADSVIELFSSAVLLWRLRAGPGGEEREQTALKLVGASFFALAAYVTFGAIRDLALHQRPEVSYPGIALAVAALVAMPLLARAKRRVAASLQSRAMQADSRQSDFCAYLSSILLAGLILNAFFRWWWADPAAALVMVVLMLREGVQAFRGETCCDCAPASIQATPPAESAPCCGDCCKPAEPPAADVPRSCGG
jgi:divalent metal cation (Fe/Co/Zn/Cd) transporter